MSRGQPMIERRETTLQDTGPPLSVPRSSAACGGRSIKITENLQLGATVYLKDVLLMSGAFLRAPALVGSVAPSSQALARTVISSINPGGSARVVELGVGTGALTRALMARGVSPKSYTGVEVDPRQVARLRERFPEMTFFQDSAENVHRIAGARRVRPSHVVASLPWTFMSSKTRTSLLSRVVRALRPEGQLLTYSYVSSQLMVRSARAMERDFQDYFRQIERSPVVWRNLPPAIAWTCSR